jgi:hypothetical protein
MRVPGFRAAGVARPSSDFRRDYPRKPDQNQNKLSQNPPPGSPERPATAIMSGPGPGSSTGEPSPTDPVNRPPNPRKRGQEWKPTSSW